MSVKVDVDRSTRARTDGNTSFKKGRWTEAIGHYTTAIVFNPQDGLGYTNRAAAFLKIDKWKDAERDCTTALSLSDGKPNVKALYRRALARKALDDVDGALEDIEAVLKVEATNETALEEKVELEDSRRKANIEQEAKSKKVKALPPSPPRSTPPSLLPPSSDQESESTAQISTDTIEERRNDLEPNSIIPVSVNVQTSKHSFADLKKGRQAGKKTFAQTPIETSPISRIREPESSKSAPTEASLNANAGDRSKSPSTLPMNKIALDDQSPPSTSASKDIGEPISLLDPLSPGSALALISAIRRYPPSATYPLIAYLSVNPASIGKMLDNFLEPDQLTLVLQRLKETLEVQRESDLDERKEVVRRFIVGMTQTRRWVMTAIMLSKVERQLGQNVWIRVGGEGDFTRRHEI